MSNITLMRWGRIDLWILGLALLAIVSSVNPAKAQFWPDENTFSRQVVYATCGEPQIPVQDKCMCGGLLAYDNNGTAGLDVPCNSKLVPNLIHPDMTTPRMLRFLIQAYYGSDVTTFCDSFDGNGSCLDPSSISGIGEATDEAYFVGHFTGVLLGEESCLKAGQGADASQWAKGPAIGEMDRSALSNPANFAAFEKGCRNHYRTVLNWLDQQ